MKIILTKPQLLHCIKESLKDSDYKSEDFYDVFITEFKKFIYEKYDGKIKKVPISYYINEHLLEFLKKIDYPDEDLSTKDSEYYNYRDFADVGSYMVNSGMVSMSDLFKGELLLVKYRGRIQELLDFIEKPNYLKLTLTEIEPHNLILKVDCDFMKYITSFDESSITRYRLHNIASSFEENLKNFLNLKTGLRSHGKFNLDYEGIDFINYETWVKEIFKKKIAKKIRENFNIIKTIRFIIKANETPTLKITCNGYLNVETRQNLKKTIDTVLAEYNVDRNKISLDLC